MERMQMSTPERGFGARQLAVRRAMWVAGGQGWSGGASDQTGKKPLAPLR